MFQIQREAFSKDSNETILGLPFFRDSAGVRSVLLMLQHSSFHQHHFRSLLPADKRILIYMSKQYTYACNAKYTKHKTLECGPMPNVMATLPNIGDALCSTPQSLADC